MKVKARLGVGKGYDDQEAYSAIDEAEAVLLPATPCTFRRNTFWFCLCQAF